jgi:beta-lactam-binding protein with PASTA domain
VGQTLAQARSRLAAQPLTTALIYKPATAGERLDVVVRQFPSGGTLSSYQKVTLVLPKALHGLVPRVVGLSLPAARARLTRLKLRPVVRFGRGRLGRVVSQEPRAGVAAGPGMTVRLVVGRP